MNPQLSRKENKMTNIKGEIDMVSILSIVIALVIGGLLFWVILTSNNEFNSGEKDCSNQCIKQKMTFESYTGGGYRNYVCNCLDENKLIKTIYSK